MVEESRARIASHAAAECVGQKFLHHARTPCDIPLSLEAHDTGFRVSVLFHGRPAKSLGLRPGDEVLDFGAGSCYVSELLNRFGYRTVALDIDREVLAIGS